MFDKILFDRNALDRSVSSDGLTVNTLASGGLNLKMVVDTPINILPLTGSSKLVPGVGSLADVGVEFVGSGDLKNTSVVLRANIRPGIQGSGSLKPGVVVKTPISAKLEGESSFKIDNRLYSIQFISTALSGTGVQNIGVGLATNLAPFSISGAGDVFGIIPLRLPININVSGRGDFELRRLGAFNENVLELIGINLMPGETVTIDTDLLQVLLGAKEDVSAVTNDSVFFELSPGQNELVISTDSNGQIDVAAIWQNRWL